MNTTMRIELDTRHMPEGAPIVVACSGGGDSMALLHLVVREAPRKGWEVSVAHFDHGIRADSAEDADFVARRSGELGVPVVTERVEVPPARRGGESLEAAARRLRYGFLRRVMRQRGQGARVVTGHTADDQAETVALRLERKAGLRGLRGILPCRRDGIVRPLLRVRRRDLRAWLEREGIAWREDPTNRDLSIPRNLWRRRIEGLSEQMQGNLMGACDVLTTASRRLYPHLSGLAGWWAAREPSRPLMPGEFLLESPRRCGHFSGLDHALLDAALKAAGADPRTVSRRLRRVLVQRLRPAPAASQEGGLYRAASGIWVESITEGLLFSTRADPHWDRGGGPVTSFPLGRALRETVEIDLPRGGRVRGAPLPAREGAREGIPGEPDGTSRIVVDASALPDVLRIRYPQGGDRMVPFGMEGRRRLKDLMREAGVPRLRRGRLPVMVRGREILWLGGVRASEASRADPASDRLVVLEFRMDGSRGGGYRDG